MKANIEESIIRITNKINSLNITEETKKKMIEVLQAIRTSANGRINLPQKDSNISEYLTLRNEHGLTTGPLELCIVTKIINPTTKLTENRAYNFPSLTEIVNLVQDNIKFINSEIANAKYYAESQTLSQKNEVVESSPVKIEFREVERVKAEVAKMDIPAHKKKRTIEALNSIMNSPRNRIYAKKTAELEEYIAVRSETLTLIRRYDDPLSVSSNKTREYKTLYGMSLINYIDENRETIDEEINRYKKR